MPIEGLHAYIAGHRLYSPHQLYGTKLLLDARHLSNELHLCYLESHSDQFYGGDYPHFTAYITKFFKSLVECDITPIIFMDCGFVPPNCEMESSEFEQQLLTAQALYQGRVPANEESIAPCLKSMVFNLIIKQMGFRCYAATTRPVEELLPQMALDLKCPVLSNETDLLVYNLLGGVIPLCTLLIPPEGTRVQVGDNGIKYLQCELFKLDQLPKLITGIRLDLVSICGPILGNYLDLEESAKIVSRFPKITYRAKSTRDYEIHQVLSWIATQDSLSSALSNLKRFTGNPNHIVLKRIQERMLTAQRTGPGFVQWRIEKYFKDNYEKLFPLPKGMPIKLRNRLVLVDVDRRLINIMRHQVEFHRPLVDDFSLDDSVYRITDQLIPIIYGLLRQNATEPGTFKNIIRHVRKGYRRTEQTIEPQSQLNGKLLPTPEEIIGMQELERQDLFFDIIGFSCTFFDEIKETLKLLKMESADHESQLATCILYVIYFIRNYPHDMWIEFVYALISNILLIGNFCGDEQTKSVITTFLPLDSASEQKPIIDHLNRLGTLIPRIIPAYSYKPKITHYFNSFQVCLQDLTFLSQILMVSKTFHMNQIVFGLQGSFLYNLTNDLIAHTSPLKRLEDDLLQGDKFPFINGFRKVSEFIFEKCGRHLQDGNDVNHSNGTNRCFVYGSRLESNQFPGSMNELRSRLPY